jgi:predicted transcriptional regulator
MNVLWERQKSTIRQIAEHIYDNVSSSEYATIQSLLTRLEKKGYVKRDKTSFAHQFCAVVEQREFIGQKLQDVADNVCNGAYFPLLVNLVDKTKLSEDQKAEIKRMIDTM